MRLPRQSLVSRGETRKRRQIESVKDYGGNIAAAIAALAI